MRALGFQPPLPLHAESQEASGEGGEGKKEVRKHLVPADSFTVPLEFDSRDFS
jgi:hypothetical protein